MNWIIDRFEEGCAVIEETGSLEVILCPIADLPKGVKEGDVLIREGAKFIANPAETAARTARIQSKMDRLKKGNIKNKRHCPN